jgi:hypothetical protein
MISALGFKTAHRTVLTLQLADAPSSFTNVRDGFTVTATTPSDFARSAPYASFKVPYSGGQASTNRAGALDITYHLHPYICDGYRLTTLTRGTPHFRSEIPVEESQSEG